MITLPRTAAVTILLTGFCLVAVLCGRLATSASAQARPPGTLVDMTVDPNTLLTDLPTSDFALDKRRLGDPADSGNKPFSEFRSFPFRYGVTNGKITSMLCPGDRMKTIDVEPTPAGLQMKLGKADDVVAGDDETILYWYAKKRAAAVGDGEIKWFAVYK